MGGLIKISQFHKVSFWPLETSSTCYRWLKLVQSAVENSHRLAVRGRWWGGSKCPRVVVLLTGHLLRPWGRYGHPVDKLVIVISYRSAASAGEVGFCTMLPHNAPWHVFTILQHDVQTAGARMRGGAGREKGRDEFAEETVNMMNRFIWVYPPTVKREKKNIFEI